MMNILIMKLRTVFAKNLKKRRKELGLSQEELAHRAGLDRSYISSLERSKYAISVDRIEKIAHELEIAPNELLNAEFSEG